MLVCFMCGRELECVRNGVGVRWGEAHVYSGDLFGCRHCGHKIIRTVDSPVYDPDNKIRTIRGVDPGETGGYTSDEYCDNLIKCEVPTEWELI